MQVLQRMANENSTYDLQKSTYWSQKFWGKILLCFLLARYIHPKAYSHTECRIHSMLEMVRNSTHLPQLGPRVSDGEKHYSAWEHASEMPRNVNKFETEDKNEVPNVPALLSLLQKCSSTLYQVNVKQNCACKDCFCVFAISFYTLDLNQGKTAVEARKN